MANHAPVIRIPGTVDFFLPDFGGPNGYVYTGDGNGGFTQGAQLPADLADGVLVDVNNDGTLDVVQIEYDPRRFTTSLGLGDGGFAFSDFTSVAGAVVRPLTVGAGDFNGDGNLDLVASFAGNIMGYTYGDGAGLFKTPQYITTLGLAGALQTLAEDINGDGLADIVNVNNATTYMSLFTSTGAGFGAEQQINVGYVQHYALAGDMNGDGLADLLVLEDAGNRFSVLLQNADHTFAAPLNTTLPASSAQYLSTGDVDHDGNLDVLVSMFGGAELYFGDGHGGFRSHDSVLPSGIPVAELVDINRDGNLDIVNTNGAADTYFGNGAGAFTFVTTSPVSGGNQSFEPKFGYIDDAQHADAAGVATFSNAKGNAITLFDADAHGDAETLTLTAKHGTLTLASLTGVTITGGANGSDSVTLRGSLANLNAALDGLRYVADAGYDGNDVIGITLNDNGNGGAALTASEGVTVIVDSTLAPATSGNDTLAAITGRIDGGGGIDTVSFNFKLTEASVSYAADGSVTIDGPGGAHSVLTGVEVYKFTDGTVTNNDVDPLVDDLFYYSHNHDVWLAGADADAHYHAAGWKEGRDPDAFFSTKTYQAIYADARGVDPLAQFDSTGWKSGRIASLSFDTAAYLKTNTDMNALGVDPLKFFLNAAGDGGHTAIAATQLLAANGFDYVYYLKTNPDVAAAGVDPLAHFQTVGWKEGRNPNALFDTNGYLNTYADVKAAGVNPLDHYNTFGWKEGRDPSVNFDTADYLAANSDIQAAHINPLTHYLQFGAYEGRSAHADGLWG